MIEKFYAKPKVFGSKFYAGLRVKATNAYVHNTTINQNDWNYDHLRCLEAVKEDKETITVLLIRVPVMKYCFELHRYPYVE